MLDNLIKFFLSEEVGKQILKKIPYTLMISLLVYIVFFSGSVSEIGLISAIFVGLFLLIFVVSTCTFQSRINRKLGASFGDFDFKSVVGTFSSVYENQASFLDELKARKVLGLVIWALLNGVSLLVVLSATFLLLLVDVKPGVGTLLAVTMLGVVYLVYDISRSSVVETPADAGSTALGFDLFERFVVTNSLARLPKRLRSEVPMYILGRLVGPLVILRKPDFGYEAPLVYESPELISLIKRLIERNTKVGLCLIQDKGDSASQFFVSDPTDEKITDLVEQSAKKVFPYLLDPSYSEPDKPRKGWISFAVKDLNADQTVGRIFIHRFKVAVMRPSRKLRRPWSVSRRGALQFLMFGKRGYIEYISTQIGLNSTRVPPNVQSGEEIAQ